MSRQLKYALVLFLLTGLRAMAAEIRYEDVYYLDEWDYPPLHLKTLRRAPITFSRDPRSVIAYLAPGQTVTVVGLGEKLDYVAAQIATGPARGWVDPGALEEPPPGIIEELRQLRARMIAHRELIARHEVALEMTRAEVHASLGRPDRKSRVRSEMGEEEQWLYITYQYLPFYTHYYDETGQLRQLVSYRREPAGHKIITFHGNQVAEIAEEQASKRRAPAVIVVPPVEIVK